MFRVEIKRAGLTTETINKADYMNRLDAFRDIKFLADEAGVEIDNFTLGMLSAFNLYGVAGSNGDDIIYLTSDFEYAAHITGIE